MLTGVFLVIVGDVMYKTTHDVGYKCLLTIRTYDYGLQNLYIFTIYSTLANTCIAYLEDRHSYFQTPKLCNTQAYTNTTLSAHSLSEEAHGHRLSGQSAPL